MDFSFFTTDNKSGYKTKEKWFSKNYPEDYMKIIDYSNNINLQLSFKEKIYFYFNNKTERPKCLTCNNEIKFRERFDIPYGDFCSLTCINNNKEEMKKRQTLTFKKKYGVEYFTQLDDFVKKQKLTKLEKYGDENYNNITKSKETKKIKYGDENYNNITKSKETCNLKYGVDNYSKSNLYLIKNIEKFKSIYPNLNFKNINKETVEIICNDCNGICEIHKQLLYERYKRNYIVCTTCNPIGNTQRSGYENEVCEFLKSINVEFITNKKLKNNRQEIDIYLPKYNLGIEINGVYWHNELYKKSDYHLNKTNLCNEEGINLIHIFEDEWVYKKDIVKSIIKNKLKLINQTIYGRNCIIKELDNETIKYFLDKNHIQGHVNSKYRIGLYYEDILVSVMTFGKGRIMMGGKIDEYELTRFCNLINYNIIGSASKLLKYFIKKYSPNKIVSYSDIRLFNGDLYKKLNFEMILQSKPNYYYVINGIRRNRFNYRKSVLVKQGFDKNKTEKQIMFDRNIYRIYDCGNIRWELNF